MSTFRPDWLKRLEAEALPEALECAQRGSYCWRGMGAVAAGQDGSSGVESTNPVRRPRSMALELSRACDAWFEARFGWRARSDHTLFVTGSREQAARFGRPVIVMPLAPARYVWSPRIEDLSRHLEALGVARPAEVAAALEAGDYRDGDLEAAIASGHEIMIRCERYHWSVPVEGERTS